MGLKKLTQEQWAALRGEWEKGELISVLSRKYGVNRSTITRRSRRAGWKERGALYEQAVSEARDKAVAEIKTTYKEAALAAHSRHLQVFRALQGIGARCLLLLEASINEPNVLKRRAATAEIHALAALTSALRNACDAERGIMRLDRLDYLTGDEREDGFDRLCNFLERARDARGIRKEE